jgi:hypothetical protein
MDVTSATWMLVDHIASIEPVEARAPFKALVELFALAHPVERWAAARGGGSAAAAAAGRQNGSLLRGAPRMEGTPGPPPQSPKPWKGRHAPPRAPLHLCPHAHFGALAAHGPARTPPRARARPMVGRWCSSWQLDGRMPQTPAACHHTGPPSSPPHPAPRPCRCRAGAARALANFDSAWPKGTGSPKIRALHPCMPAFEPGSDRVPLKLPHSIQEAADEIEARLPGARRGRPRWSACEGSQPGSRGFTCGLWLLFHAAAARCARPAAARAPGAAGRASGCAAGGRPAARCWRRCAVDSRDQCNPCMWQQPCRRAAPVARS